MLPITLTVPVRDQYGALQPITVSVQQDDDGRDFLTLSADGVNLTGDAPGTYYVDSPTPTITGAQADAIASQVKVYESGGMTGTECAGLLSYRVERAEDGPTGAVDVHFTYLDHDGSPGYEVTTFDHAGNVTSSQDYG
jgi:hypothetical protein